jgi:hypothetical protein
MRVNYPQQQPKVGYVLQLEVIQIKIAIRKALLVYISLISSVSSEKRKD